MAGRPEISTLTESENGDQQAAQRGRKHARGAFDGCGQPQDAADNLLALAKLHTYILWPQGSGLDNPQLKGKTAAKPEIWQNKQEVTLLQQDLVAALEVLVYNASWSLEGISDGIKDVNRACVTCHNKYMVEN